MHEGAIRRSSLLAGPVEIVHSLESIDSLGEEEEEKIPFIKARDLN